MVFHLVSLETPPRSGGAGGYPTKNDELPMAEPGEVKSYEGLQRPGDVIFVPGDGMAASVAWVAKLGSVVQMRLLPT